MLEALDVINASDEFSSPNVVIRELAVLFVGVMGMLINTRRQLHHATDAILALIHQYEHRILEPNNENKELKWENSLLERYNKSLKETQGCMGLRQIDNAEWRCRNVKYYRKHKKLLLARRALICIEHPSPVRPHCRTSYSRFYQRGLAKDKICSDARVVIFYGELRSIIASLGDLQTAKAA